MKTVSEIITTENSFFGVMKTNHGDLFSSLFDDTTTSGLDMQLLVKCGSRYCSPLLSHYDMLNVVDYIVTKYGENWKRIKETLKLDYDVLAPYKVTQTTTSNKTATNTNEGESRQENGIVAFDSEESTPSTVDTNNDKTTQNISEDNTATVENKGNNGNFKNADLITNEIEVRKTSFIDLVLNDIQSQITLDIY